MFHLLHDISCVNEALRYTRIFCFKTKGIAKPLTRKLYSNLMQTNPILIGMACSTEDPNTCIF